MASLHALAGDAEQALDWLQRAYEEHNPGLVYLRASYPLQPLLSLPRGERILRALDFP